MAEYANFLRKLLAPAWAPADNDQTMFILRTDGSKLLQTGGGRDPITVADNARMNTPAVYLVSNDAKGDRRKRLVAYIDKSDSLKASSYNGKQFVELESVLASSIPLSARLSGAYTRNGALIVYQNGNALHGLVVSGGDKPSVHEANELKAYTSQTGPHQMFADEEEIHLLYVDDRDNKDNICHLSCSHDHDNAGWQLRKVEHAEFFPPHSVVNFMVVKDRGDFHLFVLHRRGRDGEDLVWIRPDRRVLLGKVKENRLIPADSQQCSIDFLSRILKDVGSGFNTLYHSMGDKTAAA